MGKQTGDWRAATRSPRSGPSTHQRRTPSPYGARARRPESALSGRGTSTPARPGSGRVVEHLGDERQGRRGRGQWQKEREGPEDAQPGRAVQVSMHGFLSDRGRRDRLPRRARAVPRLGAAVTDPTARKLGSSCDVRPIGSGAVDGGPPAPRPRSHELRLPGAGSSLVSSGSASSSHCETEQPQGEETSGRRSSGSTLTTRPSWPEACPRTRDALRRVSSAPSKQRQEFLSVSIGFILNDAYFRNADQ